MSASDSPSGSRQPSAHDVCNEALGQALVRSAAFTHRRLQSRPADGAVGLDAGLLDAFQPATDPAAIPRQCAAHVAAGDAGLRGRVLVVRTLSRCVALRVIAGSGAHHQGGRCRHRCGDAGAVRLQPRRQRAALGAIAVPAVPTRAAVGPTSVLSLAQGPPPGTALRQACAYRRRPWCRRDPGAGDAARRRTHL